ncbi:ankyrin [Daldinia bambusicola]|nr:ankyrin [Daldinia bambusicola]
MSSQSTRKIKEIPLDLRERRASSNDTKSDQLLRRAEEGNVNAIVSLLNATKGEPCVDAKDSKGMTALAIAVKNKRTEAVSKLLEYNPGRYIQDKNGMTALHWAAKNGDFDMTKRLLSENHITATSETTSGSKLAAGGETSSDTRNKAAGSNTRGLTGNTQDSKEEGSQACNKVGVNIDLVDFRDRTPLYLASENGSVETVKYLLEQGADERLSDKGRMTPMEIAAVAGREHVIKELRNNKWDTGGLGEMPAYCLFPNFTTSEDTSLCLGRFIQNPEAMEVLRDTIIDPEKLNNPIHNRTLAGFKVSLTDAKTGQYGPWAKAMAQRLEPQKKYDRVEVDEVKTKFFYPSLAYLEQCVDKSPKFGTVYVITGMKIAYGALLSQSTPTMEKRHFVLAVCLWKISRRRATWGRRYQPYGYPDYMVDLLD